jgi:signal transduction histidine kinase
MKPMECVPSGLPQLGDLPRGSHVCHFFESGQDLADTLVPYFKLGLERNEQCLWVTAEPFEASAAWAALNGVVPDLDRRIEHGQIAILGRRETLDTPLDRLRCCGDGGLRFAGNLVGLDSTIPDRPIIALDSYCISGMAAGEVLDLMARHDVTLARRDGEWQVIEHAGTSEHPTNRQLEQCVLDRTAELHAVLAARDEFLETASHELKTPITAVRLYLENLLRASTSGRLSEPERLRRLQKAVQGCERMSTVIQRLFDKPPKPVYRATAAGHLVERVSPRDGVTQSAAGP